MKDERTTFQLRIERELSEKMAEFKREKSINWSALVKKFIEETITRGAK
jgi:hypothetical protein